MEFFFNTHLVYGCDSVVSSTEGKSNRFPSLSHFGVQSDEVHRSNSIPESGDTPICE